MYVPRLTFTQCFDSNWHA